MVETMMDRARAFLALDRIALIGVERDPRGFSRAVLRALLQHGCDVVPVNPALAEAEGRPCHARVQDIDPPVRGAILMTPRGWTAMVVRDCLAAGIRNIWLHRGAGPGSASPEALELCRAADVTVVTDLCPFMALPRPGWFHGLHAFLRGGARQPARP